jgi:uroporphyrinogen-III synthase
MSDRLPLQQKRIVVTRAEAQAGVLIAGLIALGAEPIACPAIAFEPPHDFARFDQALQQLAHYDWLIFTSSNGVEAFFARYQQLGLHTWPSTLKIAVVGPATAKALAKHGHSAARMPEEYVAEALAETLGELHGQRILLAHADIAREVLAQQLRAQGAQLDDIAVYRTVPGPNIASLLPALRSNQIDAITFSSGSTVRYLLDGLAQACGSRDEARTLLQACALLFIGPIAAQAARDEQLRVDAIAQPYTSEGLIAALQAWFAAQPDQAKQS